MFRFTIRDALWWREVPIEQISDWFYPQFPVWVWLALALAGLAIVAIITAAFIGGGEQVK